MFREKAGSCLNDSKVLRIGLSLIKKLGFFVGHISIAANLIADEPIGVRLFFVPIFDEGLIESLAIGENIIVE